jgi:hypothetical protein
MIAHVGVRARPAGRAHATHTHLTQAVSIATRTEASTACCCAICSGMGGLHLPPAARILLLSTVLSSGCSELPVQELLEMSRSRSADAGDDGAISRAQVLQHQSTASMWVVVDGTWVVNVTAFLPHHPGGLKIMSATIDANFSFKHGENAHFATTATAFDDACAAFDAQPRPQAPLDFDFWRSRDNGGLNHDGQPVGPRPSTPVGKATIMGRLKVVDGPVL